MGTRLHGRKDNGLLYLKHLLWWELYQTSEFISYLIRIWLKLFTENMNLSKIWDCVLLLKNKVGKEKYVVTIVTIVIFYWMISFEGMTLVIKKMTGFWKMHLDSSHMNTGHMTQKLQALLFWKFYSGCRDAGWTPWIINKMTNLYKIVLGLRQC